MRAIRIYTVGHSNRSADGLVDLLSAWGIVILVDVRARPSSRRFPQFNGDALKETLAAAQIQYRWAGKQLGGLRRCRPGSAHRALPEALRGYAEHMATAGFSRAVERLIELGGRAPLAVMCAERAAAQCHRSLIADYLVVCRGIDVVHLVESESSYVHRPRPELDPGDLCRARLMYTRYSQPDLDLD